MSNDQRAALADLVDVHRGWCNYCNGNADWCMERDCSLARYLKSLAPAQPEGWISCSERLPDNSDVVQKDAERWTFCLANVSRFNRIVRDVGNSLSDSLQLSWPEFRDEGKRRLVAAIDAARGKER